jgi:hypothetical protein
MPDVRALSRGMQIAAASAILLLLDSFLNWQSVDLPDPLGSVGQSAWHGFWGVVMGLLVLAFIAWLAVRLFGVRLPELPVPEKTITLVVAALILIFAVIKVLSDDYRAWPAWVGIILAAGCVAGAYLMYQEPDMAEAPAAPAAPPPPASPPPADTTPPGETV